MQGSGDDSHSEAGDGSEEASWPPPPSSAEVRAPEPSPGSFTRGSPTALAPDIGDAADALEQEGEQRHTRRHAKTYHSCTTEDGWRLHLVRTQQIDLNLALTSPRQHPVLLVPGLGSSGVHSFDLSPLTSVADFLASEGWDVWIADLRGNGKSDKPSLLHGRSRWWTIDDFVTLDVPAVFRYVCARTRCSQLHVMGHSMGGMIVSRILALNGPSAARLRSVSLIGSSPFLEGSWWQAIEPLMPAARLMWTVPARLAVRLYSWLAFSRLAIAPLDRMYVCPENVDPALAKSLLLRNFSSISPGVILQLCNAFQPKGLMTRDLSVPYADPALLTKVQQPVLVIVGDRDRMCPPWGCRKAFDLLGSRDKRFVCLGPKNGQASHYGHFDVLMGKHVEAEVFPTLHEWVARHDGPEGTMAAGAAPSEREGLSSRL